MNIIIYKVITTSEIQIYITKNNKKPLHNKAYRYLHRNRNILNWTNICIYLEHCLAIESNTLNQFGPSDNKISINTINNKRVALLTPEENIEVQRLFSSNYWLDKRIRMFLNLAIYNSK